MHHRRAVHLPTKGTLIFDRQDSFSHSQIQVLPQNFLFLGCPKHSPKITAILQIPLSLSRLICDPPIKISLGATNNRQLPAALSIPDVRYRTARKGRLGRYDYEHEASELNLYFFFIFFKPEHD